MKKVLIIFMTIIGVIFVNSTLVVSAEERGGDEFVSKYETWGSDLSEEELRQYYIDNNIRPASSPSGSDGKLFYKDVSNHLESRFTAYSNWSVSTNTSYVRDVYGGNPLETSNPDLNDPDYNIHIAEAKRLAGITYDAIGCGPLAMISQFDYLARYAGYVSIAENLEDFTDPTVIDAPNFIGLATEILENTHTVPEESDLGQFLGVEGTFTFPDEIIRSSNARLQSHLLQVSKEEEIVDEEGNVSTRKYYDNDSQIVVSGDTIPNLSSFSTKINNLIDSIDRGMPVLWWTLGEEYAGDFHDHYMNIFGYEYWVGTDELGNTKTHLMFILRYNWGQDDVYMDSDLLNAINGGFIYFEEVNDRTVVKPEDYNYNWQFENIELSENVFPTLGYNFKTKYLRTAYSQEEGSDEHQMILSANYIHAGEAYLEFEFNTPIRWLYIEISWFSPNEGISSLDGEVSIQYKDIDGDWITQFDLLSDSLTPLPTSPDNKKRIRCDFNNPITEFRIYVKKNEPTTNLDLGRLILGNIMLIHTEHTHVFEYSKNNSNIHNMTCFECEYQQTASHVYDKHYCTKCNEYTSNHDYDIDPNWVDYQNHSIDCICGEWTIQPHVVKENGNNMGNGYSTCLVCNGPSQIGFQQWPMGAIRYITLNGSYILPNGVIVLKDEDVETYFNGTLVFYTQNNLPVDK